MALTSPFLIPLPPTISRVDGCDSDDAVSAINCPNLGGLNITVSGSNFGAAGANITLNGMSCQPYSSFLTPS